MVKLVVKFRGLTSALLLRLIDLSAGGVVVIPGVGVKSVDIWKKTGGEGGRVGMY